MFGMKVELVFTEKLAGAWTSSLKGCVKAWAPDDKLHKGTPICICVLELHSYEAVLYRGLKISMLCSTCDKTRAGKVLNTVKRKMYSLI